MIATIALDCAVWPLFANDEEMWKKVDAGRTPSLFVCTEENYNRMMKSRDNEARLEKLRHARNGLLLVVVK